MTIAVGLMADGLLRPFFGLAQDRFGFKPNFAVASIILALLLGTISLIKCLVPLYITYDILLLSAFAFQNVLLASTVSKVFGLHAGGQVLAVLKACGAISGLILFAIEELLL